jgi:hypothetical protein
VQVSLTQLSLPVGNCLDIDAGTVKIAADGYWVFIQPLEPGVHHLFFHGSCSGGIRNSTAVYNLTIA